MWSPIEHDVIRGDKGVLFAGNINLAPTQFCGMAWATLRDDETHGDQALPHTEVLLQQYNTLPESRTPLTGQGLPEANITVIGHQLIPVEREHWIIILQQHATGARPRRSLADHPIE